MKNERTLQWAGALYATEIPQVKRYLALRGGDEVTGACCLGIGCLTAGLTPIPTKCGTETESVLVFAFDGEDNKQLPPTPFLEWLGLDTLNEGDEPGDDEHTTEWSLMPEWGVLKDPEGSRYAMTYDNLNDALGLTFAQIADVVRYFGVVVQGS